MGRQRGGRAQQRPGTAITSHIETLLELGEPVEITQSKIEALQAYPEHAGGIWALVQLDLEKLDSKPERINISLPRFVLSKIDRLSRAALSLIEAEAKGGGAR